MKNQIALLLALITACTAPAATVTLIDANFDGLSTVADTSSVGTNLKARFTSASNTSISVVDKGSGNKALQLTDNAGTGVGANYPALFSSTTQSLSAFGATQQPGFSLSTTSTGFNQLSGSFDITMLLASNASNPRFLFNIQSPLQENSSGGNSLIFIQILGTGALSFNNGISSGAPNLVTNAALTTLAQNTTYRFSYTLDLSSATQDTWSLTVSSVSGSTVTPIFTQSNLNTTLANGTPTVAGYRGGLGTTQLNASPAWELDNISLVASDGIAIPEPASFATLGGLAAFGCTLMLRRRTRD